MNIQILNGANLINQHTTIIIQLDSMPNEEVLQYFQSLHPIFMIDYKIDGQTVLIQSHLPHFWKEAATYLNQISTEQITSEEGKQLILENVVDSQLKSMSTIPILHAAHQLGHETTQYLIAEGIDLYETGKGGQWNRYYSIGVGKQAEVTVSAGSSKDSTLGYKIQRDKQRTNMFLERLGLPIAQWMSIKSVEHLEEVFESFPKPFVLKPVGLTGGAGVTTRIDTLEKAKKAYLDAKSQIDRKERSTWQKEILIQQQVYGEDYRLLVIGGKLEIATKRIPAYVVGNGRDNLEQIINETNKDPRRDKSNPTHTLKPIVIDDMLTTFLAEQNLSLDYVPADGEQVFVRKVASMSQGGLTEDVTDIVHPQIRYIAETIGKSLHVNVAGIDLLVQDITKPLTIENGTIIEINTMPEAYLNFFPAMGKQHEDAGAKVINSLLGDKPEVKKVVLIGANADEALQKLNQKYNFADYRVGLQSDDKIYINEHLINEGLISWKALEALKLNTTLDIVATHRKSVEEIDRDGLGFDQINELVILEDIFEPEDLNQLKSYNNIKSVS